LRTTTKLATFAVVVAIVFGAAWAVGAAVGPIDNGGGTSHSSHEAATNAADLPRGLAVAEAGYRLVAESTTVAADAPSEFAFRIVDDEGMAVTTFQELHERPLHLIVLSRNLVDYWHLHPVELLLDPGRTRRARHAADVELDLFLRVCCRVGRHLNDLRVLWSSTSSRRRRP